MRDIPKIVVKRLQGAAEAEAHPEADLLSAFAEQSLADAERDRVMEHLASCGECREAVALALPDGDELAAPGLSFPTRGRWLNWPSVRWAFAAATAGVLASIGILHYQQRPAEQVASLAGPNVATKGSEPDLLSPAQAEPRMAKGGEGNNGNNNDKESPRPSRKIARSGTENFLAAKKSADLPVSGQNVSGFSRTESSVPTPENSVIVTSQAGAAVAASRNESPDLLARNQANQNLSFQRSRNSDVVKAKPALSAQDASGAPAAPGLALSLQTAPALMLHASRWSIASSGGLQRSFDAGKTWEDVNVNADSPKASTSLVFHAVAALGSEVWAGGADAVLYHSVDSGARWQRVDPSANGASASGDIVEIKFSDPENCRFATSTGEVWITLDSGATWRKQ